jgi:hypothetical protein
VLERVLISVRRARAGRAPVHATSLFSVHGRRPAGLARSCSSAAARACQHWPGVTAMVFWFRRHIRSGVVPSRPPTLIVASRQEPAFLRQACPMTSRWRRSPCRRFTRTQLRHRQTRLVKAATICSEQDQGETKISPKSRLLCMGLFFQFISIQMSYLIVFPRPSSPIFTARRRGYGTSIGSRFGE